MTDFEKTFDNAAADYEKARPCYVKEIYEDIFRYCPLGHDSCVLEIGIGTGKAAEPFVKTGCQFLALEPGEKLAAIAKQRFSRYANFSLSSQAFQDYDGADCSFDFIYAATAFHWIDEKYGYSRVYDLLKKGGVFARFAYHAGIDKSRPALSDKIQALYRQHIPQAKTPLEFSATDAQKLADKALLYGFRESEYHLYHTTKDFTADEYMALLRTYPDHTKLETAVRQSLFDSIYCAIMENGGTITVHYTMDLELARK